MRFKNWRRKAKPMIHSQQHVEITVNGHLLMNADIDQETKDFTTRCSTGVASTELGINLYALLKCAKVIDIDEP